MGGHRPGEATQPRRRKAVAGVTETGDDVALLVELLVHRGDDDGDRDVEALEVLLDAGAALGRGQQADRGDVVGAAVGEELDGRGQGAAGGQHRVEDVALPALEVLGQPLGVRHRLEGLLVAGHADEADLGGRQQPHHPVEHAETGTQDRDDQRLRRRQPHARRRGDRRDDVVRLDPHLAGGLVGEQGDQLVGQLPERRRVGALVPQGGQLVRDEGVVDDVGGEGHGRLLVGCGRADGLGRARQGVLVELQPRSLGRLLVGCPEVPVAQPVHLHAGLLHLLALLGQHREAHLELDVGQRVGPGLGPHDPGIDEPRDPLGRHLDGERVPLVAAERAPDGGAVEVVGPGADVEAELVLARVVAVEPDVELAAPLLAVADRHQLGEDAVRRPRAAVDARAEPGLPPAVRLAGAVQRGRHGALAERVEGEHPVLGADQAGALDLPPLLERADELLVVHEAAAVVPTEGVAGVDRAGLLAQRHAAARRGRVRRCMAEAPGTPARGEARNAPSSATHRARTTVRTRKDKELMDCDRSVHRRAGRFDLRSTPLRPARAPTTRWPRTPLSVTLDS